MSGSSGSRDHSSRSRGRRPGFPAGETRAGAGGPSRRVRARATNLPAASPGRSACAARATRGGTPGGARACASRGGASAFRSTRTATVRAVAADRLHGGRRRRADVHVRPCRGQHERGDARALFTRDASAVGPPVTEAALRRAETADPDDCSLSTTVIGDPDGLGGDSGAQCSAWAPRPLRPRVIVLPRLFRRARRRSPS